jgi:hypothetical protein
MVEEYPGDELAAGIDAGLVKDRLQVVLHRVGKRCSLFAISVGESPCHISCLTSPSQSPASHSAGYSSLSDLAGLVVTGGLADDDVHAVHRVHERDEAHQGGELVLVIVLAPLRKPGQGSSARREQTRCGACCRSPML